MLSSERKKRAEAEAKIIFDILHQLPNEINGGMIAALLVNILHRYEMEEEWKKIVDAVDETLRDIASIQVMDTGEVLMN
jgi:hypothetical protein